MADGMGSTEQSNESGYLDVTGIGIQRIGRREARRNVLRAIGLDRMPLEVYVGDSTHQRQLRVTALPYNPFLKKDVGRIARLFRIPKNGIVPGCPWPDDGIVLSENDMAIAEGALAVRRWLNIHQALALRRSARRFYTDLPAWFIDSASQLPCLSRIRTPKWLRKKPNVPPEYQRVLNPKVPVFRTAARLVERYHLPWNAGFKLVGFLLTGYSWYLREVRPLDVRVEPLPDSPAGAHRITIDLVDVYTTKQLWDEVYTRDLTPYFEAFNERQGEVPANHQNDVRNIKTWAGEVIERRSRRPQPSYDTVINDLNLQVDRSTVFRTVARLMEIMKPDERA